MHDKYIVSYSKLSKKESQLPPVFYKVARDIFTTSSPRTVSIHVPATPHLAIFAHWKTVYALLVLESSLPCKNVTYRLHAAHSCIKLQSKRTYGICTSVGLAQARPNDVSPVTQTELHTV